MQERASGRGLRSAVVILVLVAGFLLAGALGLVAATMSLRLPPSEVTTPGPGPEAPAPPPPRTSYDSDVDRGSVSGVVRFDGVRPPQVRLRITGDAVCEAMWKDEQGPIPDRVLVNDDGTLPHTFVWAVRGPHTAMEGLPPADPPVLTVDRCVFVPHVFGAVAGEPAFLVSSGAHACMRARPRRSPEIELRLNGGEQAFVFPEPEDAIGIDGQVETWRQAWCFVLAHPFFATTDAGGRFEIHGLPDGETAFRVWHEPFASSRPALEAEFAVSIVDGAAVARDVVLRE